MCDAGKVTIAQRNRLTERPPVQPYLYPNDRPILFNSDHMAFIGCYPQHFRRPDVEYACPCASTTISLLRPACFRNITIYHIFRFPQRFLFTCGGNVGEAEKFSLEPPETLVSIRFPGWGQIVYFSLTGCWVTNLLLGISLCQSLQISAVTVSETWLPNPTIRSLRIQMSGHRSVFS
jgi:hypothetical protein